jgi:uncharacterized protein (TIGR02246 family)
MTLSAEDQLAIHELVARYNRAIDSGDVDGWVALFTLDGAFQTRDGQRWVGSDRLREFASGYAADLSKRGSEHWVSNIILEPDGDDVRLFCHGMIVRPEGAAIEIKRMASYDDLIRREDGEWRFALRRVRAWPPVADP